MSGVLDKFIRAHKQAKDDESALLVERRSYAEQLNTTKELLLREMKDLRAKGINYIEVPPPEADKDGKPSYIRLKEDTVQGAISLNGVAATLFGTDAERENPETDLTVRWKTRLNTAMESLAARRAEALEQETKKKEEQAAKLKRRRRAVASIVKIHEEEKKASKKRKGGGKRAKGKGVRIDMEEIDRAMETKEPAEVDCE
jgi:hypothetical protein